MQVNVVSKIKIFVLADSEEDFNACVESNAISSHSPERLIDPSQLDNVIDCHPEVWDVTAIGRKVQENNINYFIM